MEDQKREPSPSDASVRIEIIDNNFQGLIESGPTVAKSDTKKLEELNSTYSLEKI